MNKKGIDREQIQNILRNVKPYFKDRLGKNTHKKRSEDWYFYGLAFTRLDLVYVFGIYLGFFKDDNDEHDNYDNIGMNVLVRTDDHPEIREKYVAFFRNSLKNWVNRPEGTYTSERGDFGIKLARYKHITEFKSEDEMMRFFEECIDGIHKLYPKIVENKDGIFDKVVLAAPQWDEGLVDFCKEHV